MQRPKQEEKANVKPQLGRARTPKEKQRPGDQGTPAMPRSGRRSPSFFLFPHHYLTSVPYIVGNAVDVAASDDGEVSLLEKSGLARTDRLWFNRYDRANNGGQ